MSCNSSVLFVFPKDYGEKEENISMLVIGSLFVSFLCIFLLYFIFVLC